MAQAKYEIRRKCPICGEVFLLTRLKANWIRFGQLIRTY